MATFTGSFTNLVLTQNPFVGFPKGNNGGFLSKAIDEQISLSSFDSLNAPSRLLVAMKCLPIVDGVSAQKVIDSIYFDFPKAKLFAIEGNEEDILETLCKCVVSDIHSTLTAIVFNPEFFPHAARLKLVIEYESERGYFHWIFHVGEDKFIFLGHVEHKSTQPINTKISNTDKVVFVKEYQEFRTVQRNSQTSTVTLTYRMYRADSRSLAIVFLENNPVDKNYLYLVVQTPEGNFCRDINGFYKEEK